MDNQQPVENTPTNQPLSAEKVQSPAPVTQETKPQENQQPPINGTKPTTSQPSPTLLQSSLSTRKILYAIGFALVIILIGIFFLGPPKSSSLSPSATPTKSPAY